MPLHFAKTGRCLKRPLHGNHNGLPEGLPFPMTSCHTPSEYRTDDLLLADLISVAKLAKGKFVEVVGEIGERKFCGGSWPNWLNEGASKISILSIFIYLSICIYI